MRDDAWFAGFVDGEGCFNIGTDNRPKFTIKLRADDFACLEVLQAAFGGSLSARPAQTEKRPGSKPQFQWWVSKKDELRGLVEYFDLFPLRSKKARDYDVWRRAALLYCRDGRGHQELPMLRQMLMEGRAYEPVEVPLSPQLRLVS